MTEYEWLNCWDSKAMAAFLRHRISPRKGRLFDVACCRQMWHLFVRAGVREAILVGERYADGQASDEELRTALRALQGARAAQPTTSPHGKAYAAATHVAARWWTGFCLQGADDAAHALAQIGGGQGRAERVIADLVREVFGNPFREVRFDASWLSPTVEAMAKSIYEDHDFGSMPILADALEDAGCDEGEVLSHCRSGGPHYRGCWALDLVLGKK